MKCQCSFHRYHVVHIHKGKVFDHSQHTWDTVLKSIDPKLIRDINSIYYDHGMTGEELFEFYNACRNAINTTERQLFSAMQEGAE